MTNDLAALLTRISRKQTARSEAQLQSDIAMFLHLAPMDLAEDDINQVVLESQLGDGTKRRIDIEVGNCIIEVKRDLARATVMDDAESQLAGYLEAAGLKTATRHAGVLTDGAQWRLYRLNGTQLDLISVLDLGSGALDVERLTLWGSSQMRV